MKILDIIAKKRDGVSLSSQEIDFITKGYAKGDVPDYQMSAFVMAAYIRGLSDEETFLLTKAMLESGESADLSGVEGTKVDKHSTGGVGDKITLILGPLMATTGLKVAKMSGNGLGHTGGTLDKLESIPGFNVNLTRDRFVKQVNDIGIALMGQTGEICPADKQIYELRDVTATVSSIPLIASSVMSKKIAGGADVLVLDVKAGSGAFMKTPEEAAKLAKALIDIAHRFNKKAVAVISNMDQPLGVSVGNSLEVQEAIDTLRGNGAPDVFELCLTLGSIMLIKAGMVEKTEDAVDILTEKIESGEALAKFREFVVAQDGDSDAIDDPRTVLPHAKFVEDYEIPVEGFIGRINAELIGTAARVLGAGRMQKGDSIDHSAGIVMVHGVGDYVQPGDVILEMHSNDIVKIAEARDIIDRSIILSRTPHKAEPMIYDIIG
jgi:pyrimidine-nucleoside phosphorylase